MVKIALIYPPFCTPASPPYSVTGIYSFLKNNSVDASVLDLNLEFHKIKFPQYGEYYRNLKKNYDKEEYESKTREYRKITSECYAANNKAILSGKEPELIDHLISKILKSKPDIAAFSIVYSSQAPYAHALITELKKRGIRTIVGGPSVSNNLKSEAEFLVDSLQLLELINGKKQDVNYDPAIDFGGYSLNKYFTPEPVIPIKTTTSCHYKRCSFCTHHKNIPYHEFDIEGIKKTIINSGQKNFFLIDDMIHKKRLLELAKAFKPLKIKWTCQLRPTSEMDYGTLKILRESGLSMLIWGVESGSNRILSLIGKGTNTPDMEKVLSDSHKAGIANVVYIIFGFPTETKTEFLETIKFLKKNEENIDLISTSVFSLQKETPIYDNPEKFGITKITETKRDLLDESLTYETAEGLSREDARTLRRKYRKMINHFGKYPKLMNFFREHMLCLTE